MLRWLATLFAPDPRELSPQQAAARIDAGARVVDVREPEEFASGSIAGATNIPLGEIRSLGVAALRRHGIAHEHDEILLVCRGGARSRAAMGLISAHGGQRLANLRGGISAWAARGRPLTRETAGTI